MADLHFSTSLFLCIVPPLLLLILTLLRNSHVSNSTKLPPSYPIIGSIPTILKNKHRRIQWLSEILTSTPNLTFTLHRPFGYQQIFTANAENVQHMLKSHFHNYPKGEVFIKTIRDFLGEGIFNADGENWKFQRQVSSHQFNTRSLRMFVETVVDSELLERLIPILRNAAVNKTVLDLQDILQRFAFDNICKIAFGYDPEYLSPSLPQQNFAVAFDETVVLSSERLSMFTPYIWKIKRALNVGSEKQLRKAVYQIRQFAKEMVRRKKQELDGKSSFDHDLLSRFLSSGHSDEDFVADIVISFMIAGRDTTSAVLTWFFYLLFNNPEVESEILREIKEKSEGIPAYEEVKDMVYVHASLCETMRLYPPVPVDTKQALNDDVLPDGTVVKKGMRVTYHPYAMGRVAKVWGEDWTEFRPKRWLERAEGGQKWNFVSRDSYTYPVFQAGPRICLGKDMAFLQMKTVVAGVLRKFKVVPVVEGGDEPVFVTNLTAKMKGGLKVRIEEIAT